MNPANGTGTATAKMVSDLIIGLIVDQTRVVVALAPVVVLKLVQLKRLRARFL